MSTPSPPGPQRDPGVKPQPENLVAFPATGASGAVAAAAPPFHTLSEKVRNPGDVPDAGKLAVLRAWQDAHAAGRLPLITGAKRL